MVVNGVSIYVELCMRYNEYMTKPTRLLRKITVIAISLPIFTVGIILIPLPGPGLLICLFALAILSLEFDKAKVYRDKIIHRFKDIIDQSKSKFKE